MGIQIGETAIRVVVTRYHPDGLVLISIPKPRPEPIALALCLEVPFDDVFASDVDPQFDGPASIAELHHWQQSGRYSAMLAARPVSDPAKICDQLNAVIDVASIGYRFVPDLR